MRFKTTTTRWVQISCLSLLFVLGGVSYAHTTTGAAWSYSGETGPKVWGTLAPAFKACAIGKQQSPININTHQATPVKNEDLDIDYHTTASFSIVSNGTTQLNIDGHKEIINDGHTLQVNFPATNKVEFLKVQQQSYRLLQFHIHTPSENHVNGKSFPLEIHFVNQGNNGKIAVVGVFVKPGKANVGIETLLKNLPATQGKPRAVVGVKLDVLSLLPKNESYYNFPGSLTTPPCTEGLQWFVMANPIEASSQQIAELKKALPLANNARPVQPLNGRKVWWFSEK
jgi:carbonic anhydrase